MTRHDHFWNLFTVAELNKKISIKKFLIDVGDGRNFTVNHYNLQLAGGCHPPPIAPGGRHKRNRLQANAVSAAGGGNRKKITIGMESSNIVIFSGNMIKNTNGKNAINWMKSKHDIYYLLIVSFYPYMR